ncbi:AMP-binding protein [Marinobacter orientalis]|uniref:AMP-binding protein n=1 Tax=Marinobacter orientalis TaxID=1928859 RepID=A0A7Y0RB88_9GAMM|nr:AMP-binding protein [Marinobacter orientalis]NMT62701.1 AMP-binding protein [Marinobacter orientalis]
MLDSMVSDAPVIFHNGQYLSFRNLADESRRVAAGLQKLGIQPGDRVAIWLPNTPEWPILYFACARLGAIAVAVNTRFRSSEVGDTVGRSGCKMIVLWPNFKEIDFVAILRDVETGMLEAVEHIVACRQTGKDTPEILPGRAHCPFEELSACAPIEQDHGTPDSSCTIFTTSGTTSAPKFVLHKQSALTSHARDTAAALDLEMPGVTLLQVLPFCGTFGLSQFLSGLASGQMAVLQTTFNAEEAVELGRRHQVTHFCASDDMVARMLSATDYQVPLPALRFCGFARFAGMPGLVERARERGIAMRGLYGMSECQALFAVQPDEPERREFGGGIPVSAEAKVRAVDPDTEQVLDHSQVGELQLITPSLMQGYFANPEATSRAYTEDGYFRTGDMGYTLADGGFMFMTRAGDALRLGGFLVAPAEIEAYLERHPDVLGCAIVTGTKRHVQRAIAFVCCDSGAQVDEADLMAFCREGLANFKVPARIFFLEEFPTVQSANGTKKRRKELRQMAHEWTLGDT